jgi:hypothetical protein
MRLFRLPLKTALSDKYPTPRSAFASRVPARWNTVKRNEVDAAFAAAEAESVGKMQAGALADSQNRQAVSVFK